MSLNENLDYASDLTVKIYSRKKSSKYRSYDIGEKENLVGTFTIPLTSITTLWTKPQYFNVIDHENYMRGKVLARFFLVEKGKNKMQ